ncbi:hypothetical protein IGI39_004264 [Enterococcus sp. AZ135]|uniref:transcriptional regulator GutM n=1 Tax=unclassified Enterococcus TaxID=2608891 RepID=UPI003F29D022
MAELRLALLVVLLLVLNVFTSLRHSNYYKKTVNSIVKENNEGFLGIGMSQSRFKARSIVLMVANPNGIIEECQVMTGLTIFAKFKRYSAIEDHRIDTIPENLLAVKHGEALKQSIDFIKNEIKMKKTSEERT